MNAKTTLIYIIFFIFAAVTSKAQIITKNIPPNADFDVLEGRVFQTLLFAKEYPDSATLVSLKNDPYGAFQEPLTNNRVVLNFKDGTLESSWVADKKFEICTTPLITLNGNLIAFTTNCSSHDPDVNGVWSGIIKRSSIRGNFCWQLPGGKSVCFAFYGSESKRDRTPEEKPVERTLSIK